MESCPARSSPRLSALPAVRLLWAILAVQVLSLAASPTPAAEPSGLSREDPALAPAGEALGDTLTVIQRPLLNMPAFVLPGGSFPIFCEAPAGVAEWNATLLDAARSAPLLVTEAVYEPSTLWWRLTAEVPAEVPSGLYDLRVTAAGGLDDTARHAVKVLIDYRTDYYFVHITDPHLPTHLNYDVPGAGTDSSSTVDLREVINDVNLINPEFVLLTGDLVNEGELEDFQQHRYFSRAQRLLGEFEVPVFLTAGNHDLGGWDATPPPAGTARRTWWRFFGWKRLADPPSGAPARTQDFSFDYGSVHYVGLEAYINYDRWRSDIYGAQSFTSAQIDWLRSNLRAAAGSASRVLFYHDDFSSQLDLRGLGVALGLWGHIHRDSGSLTARPYNLATGTTADGQRTYRVVRVSNGVVTPLPSVRAGDHGENLEVAYTPANDGTHASVSAVVSNDLPISFENALLRFNLPKTGGEVRVEGGTLLQSDDSGSTLTCRVVFDLRENAVQMVSASIEPPALRLEQNVPNPFALRRASHTIIGYSLPTAGPVRLALFASNGRRVATLVNGEVTAGPHMAEWAGRDDHGRPLPSGAYLLRLKTAGGVRSRSLIFLK